MKLYGIPNCDTVKKAQAFLDTKKIPYEFVNFKNYRPTVEDLTRWTLAFGNLPVNQKGQTYRKHKDQYEKLSEKDKMTFIQDNTSMIKRPILEDQKKVLAFGFDETNYSKLKSK